VYSGENGGNGGFAVGEGSEANGANGQDGGYAIGEGSEANGQDGGYAIGQGSEANGQDGGYAIGQGSEANGGGVATFGGKTGPDCSIAVGDSCFNQPEGIFNPF